MNKLVVIIGGDDMTKQLHKAIIIGAIWGMTEATVGYVLHLFAAQIGWMLWFPIAFLFIHMAYGTTKSYALTILSAGVAASLKLINLFFPVRADMVFNPAVSILLEALSVVLVYHYITKNKKNEPAFFEILLIGFTWRVLYVSYVHLLPTNLLEISPAGSMQAFARFLFFENVLNTLLITVGMLVVKKFRLLNFERLYSRMNLAFSNKPVLKPVVSVLSLVIAVFLKLVTI